jgi:hypothetical protein
LLDDAAEGSLRLLGHHVRLVEDDEFVAFGEERARLRKLLDLLAYNVDATVVRRVELGRALVRRVEVASRLDTPRVSVSGSRSHICGARPQE